MERKRKRSFTKIICTIGPSSNEKKILKDMIRNGMNVARLNFSHGTHADKKEAISNIRSASSETSIPVAILADLSGPKIRMGILDKPVPVKKNSYFEIGITKKSGKEVFTDFKKFGSFVKKNDRILVDDGMIELKAVDIESGYVRVKVINPGIIKSHKGINLPDVDFEIEVFTSKDRKDLLFALENGVDLIAMSFVDSSKNVIPIKHVMKKMDCDLPVIAKIERPQALKNLEEIVDSFDGIMIARGDLGVEVPLEEVPFIQKKLNKMASDRKKIVITATQMLESMVHNPTPTRAEVSDVTNAILEGTDLVMLSGETAVGEYPAKSADMMRKIALTTECSSLFHYALHNSGDHGGYNESIAKGAAEMAMDLKADSIMVFSFSGNTALLLSKFRPPCPVYAFSPSRDIVLRMSSYWGITPVYIEFTSHTDEMIAMGEKVLKKMNLIRKGDTMVTVAGETPMKGATNMIKLLKIE